MLLAEGLRATPTVAVRLEAIEDVDVISDDDKVTRHVQAKHHLDDYTLTDRSPELWTTLTVWMDLARKLGDAVLPALQLGHDVCGRRRLGRLVSRSHRSQCRICARSSESVATEQGAEKTREARHRFAELGRAPQLTLLSAATILDASERVTQLDDRLRSALGMVVPLEHAAAFLERVKGWWVQRSVELLAGERDQIGGDELYRFCD